MTYQRIPSPGAMGGPCVEASAWCGHNECSIMRILAGMRCAICGVAIGYGQDHYGTGWGPAHAECMGPPRIIRDDVPWPQVSGRDWLYTPPAPVAPPVSSAPRQLTLWEAA